MTWSKRDLDPVLKPELEVNCSQPGGHIESDSKGLAARTSVHLQPKTTTLKTQTTENGITPDCRINMTTVNFPSNAIVIKAAL